MLVFSFEDQGGASCARLYMVMEWCDSSLSAVLRFTNNPLSIRYEPSFRSSFWHHYFFHGVRACRVGACTSAHSWFGFLKHAMVVGPKLERTRRPG